MELIGVRESAGINRLGIRNERVLCYSAKWLPAFVAKATTAE